MNDNNIVPESPPKVGGGNQVAEICDDQLQVVSSEGSVSNPPRSTDPEVVQRLPASNFKTK